MIKSKNKSSEILLDGIEPNQILIVESFSEHKLILLYLGDYNFFYRLLSLFIHAQMGEPQAGTNSTKKLLESMQLSVKLKFKKSEKVFQ